MTIYNINLGIGWAVAVLNTLKPIVLVFFGN